MWARLPPIACVNFVLALKTSAKIQGKGKQNTIQKSVNTERGKTDNN